MQKILLPDKKPFSDGAVISSWLKKVGENINIGEVIVNLEIAGGLIELQAPCAGVLLKVHMNTGQILTPGTILGVIGRSKEQDMTDKQNSLTPVTAQPHNQMSDTSPANVIPILMPQAGQTMEEGTLIKWHIKEGDRIEVGQIILDIETDKAVMEVEADQAGRLAKIIAQEGDIVEVKQPIAYLAEDDVQVEVYLQAACNLETISTTVKPEPPKKAPSNQTITSPKDKTDTGRVKASPAARRLAAERGMDLTSISRGSGPGGRILAEDIDKAPAISSGPTQTSMSKMRLAIANNLLWSKQNIPHFYAKRVVDAQDLYDTYQKIKQDFKCTLNDFITVACARVIREFPAFRSQFHDKQIIELPAINIGIAVSTDEGLTVPVLLHADQMDLQTLAQKTKQIVEKARAGKLEGVGQGIFTITNMGMLGIEEFQAIINPPESAILAVGAIREDIMVENGSIKPTRLMTLCLSVDHRVIDGVTAALFLNKLKELLEVPECLL